MQYEEKTLSTKHVYKGKFISLDTVEVELPDGNKSTRDIVLHPGASVVVPVNEDKEIYMVRQYRKPIEKITIELPAGKLDEGEDPKVCAERELKEETGIEASEIKHMISIHSTPGFSTEVLHMYLATGLKEGTANSDEDEFVSCEKYKIDDLIDMIMKNEITDAKTIIGILMADRIINREKY
jgi:ADP-ribose pyrophosphatase